MKNDFSLTAVIPVENFFLIPMSHTWITQPLNVNMCNHIQNKVEFFIGVIMSAADAKDDDIN